MEATWAAISALPPAIFLQRNTLAYLLLNAAHIASLGLLIGSVITLDVRLLGGFRAVSLSGAWSMLARMAALGLVLAMLTGALLFSVNAPGYAQNRAFQIKLCLIFAGVLNALCLHRRALNVLRNDIGPIGSIKLHAALSVALWLGVVVAGRWIGFL